MIDYEKTAKLSKKGQITLPKKVREFLGSNVVKVVIENGQVRLEPLGDLAGSLSQYAKEYIPFEEARDRAWEAEVNEKYSRR